MENQKNSAFKNNCGFSLIELIVALFLSSTLMAGLATVYLSVRSSYRFQNSFANIQEKIRLTNEILNKRVYLAGFSECENKTKIINQKQAIKGSQGQSGNDVLTLGECYPDKGHERFAHLSYFVAKTSRVNKQSKPIYALFVRKNSGRRLEIAEGISQMQVRYGNHYLSASQVKDWLSINSVQITLLFNSVNAVLREPKSYWFAGKKIVASDRRLHKAMTFYYALRERQ